MGRKLYLSKEEIIQHISSGGTLTSLAKLNDVTKSAMCHYAKSLGIEPKIGKPIGIPMSEEQKDFRSRTESGQGNQFYGKKHSEKSRMQMSANHADFTGDKNPFKRSLEINPENRVLLSESRKNWWKSLTTDELNIIKQNCSDGQSKADHHDNMKNSRSGFYNSVKAGKVFYRSSWELKFAQFLDTNSLVRRYFLEPFAVDYYDVNGLRKKTRLDFVICFTNEKVAIVEIKPKALTLLLNNPQKILGQNQFCVNCGYLYYVLSDVSESNLDTVVERLFYDEEFV